jgi:hypothetical protein
VSTPLLAQLEEALNDDADESLPTALVVLASLAGREIVLEEAELHGAARRALLLLAAGGDPERGLDLNGRAVASLAGDLRTVDRQLTLERGIGELKIEARDLPHVLEALKALGATPDVAWRAYACSLLAEELAGEE